MRTVNVVFDFENENGLKYYRTMIHSKLVCIVDGAWHTAVDDGTWNEPIGSISMSNLTIEIKEV